MFPYGWAQSFYNKPKPSGQSKPKEKSKYSCPLCGHYVLYLGVTPAAIECSNSQCKWFRPAEVNNEDDHNKYGYYDGF